MNANSKIRFGVAVVAALVVTFTLPATASGADVAETIGTALNQSGVQVRELKVVDVEGIIIVRGKVNDREAYNRITPVLNSVGHARVANLVRIVPPPDDRAIERLVERRLGLSRSLEGARLRVEAEQGVVRLFGTVESEYQRDTVNELVRSVDGVREVQSFLVSL